MSLLGESDVLDMPKETAKRRKIGYRSGIELQIRTVLEGWCRARWPDGRQIHELVISRGVARADMAVVTPDRFVAIEIKGPLDNTHLLMHQAGLFRLASSELWIVVAETHLEDAEMIHWMLPSVGVAVVSGLPAIGDRAYYKGSTTDLELGIQVVHEPLPFQPHPKALLSVLWVEELREQALRYGLKPQKTHLKLVEQMMRSLSPEQQLDAVCTALRGREFAFRSDAPEWKADSSIR